MRVLEPCGIAVPLGSFFVGVDYCAQINPGMSEREVRTNCFDFYNARQVRLQSMQMNRVDA